MIPYWQTEEAAIKRRHREAWMTALEMCQNGPPDLRVAWASFVFANHLRANTSDKACPTLTTVLFA